MGFEKTKKLQKRLLITIFFKCRPKKKNPLKALLFHWRDVSCVIVLIFRTQQEVLSQTKSLPMQGDLGGRTLALEPTRSPQAAGSHRASSGRAAATTCGRGSAHPACAPGKLCLTMPLPCIYFLWSCAHFLYLLDSFADVVPPPHLQCSLLLCLLLLLFYTSLLLQTYIFKQAKSQYSHSFLYTKIQPHLLLQFDWLAPVKLGEEFVQAISEHGWFCLIRDLLHWQISGATNQQGLVPSCWEQQLLPLGQPAPKNATFLPKATDKFHHNNNAAAAKE